MTTKRQKNSSENSKKSREAEMEEKRFRTPEVAFTRQTFLLFILIANRKSQTLDSVEKITQKCPRFPSTSVGDI